MLFTIATSTPLLKDLYENITPQYATDWKVIGALLGLSKEKLKVIEHDNYHKAVSCCNAMLEEWLEVDHSASWNKLLSVIHSPAVSNDQAAEKGTEAVSLLSNRVAMMNVHAQDSVDEDTWPPDQPKEYTPLLLIQHQEQRTKEQDSEMAKLIQTGDIDSLASGQLASKHYNKLDNREILQHVLNTSSVTKEVKEILTPLERSDGQKFVLIEGAPGIGKSVLLKHIALQWGKKIMLTMFKIVLLVCLRDPNIWKVTSVHDLLKLFCKGDTKEKATEIAMTCSDFLLANGGKDVTFLFDGYDEFPEHLKKSSLIAGIIKRTTLPLCGLVVSSRPHASVSLRERASIKVDILGFTEKEREQFIKQALKRQPYKIEELTQYLQHHMTINSLCFVPFNMVVILFLHKNGLPLPKNSTELCNYFICLTICRHLAKTGHPLKNNITNLTTLPEPYKKIVQQLAKLSLEALNSNKLVFTSEDIEAACPDVIATPEAINGFGLLQAVQHFDFTGKTMTFNFLHLTIQEYLAAHYIITSLQPDEELHLLHEQFWSSLHTNMFAIYVTLTKGQRYPFKKFLSGGEDKIISNKFLRDELKSLRLYQCFKEAEDYIMCKSIEEAAIFSRKKVNLHSNSLSATDLDCVSLFLTSSSNKQWLELNLRSCYLQDRGLHIIHKYLNHSNITITKLWLGYNGLTRTSSSYISDIVLSCKVGEVLISGNHTVGENRELYTMLTHPSTMLALLNMRDTLLSSNGAKLLFTAVKNAKKLKGLTINNNAITDDVVSEITTALTMNKSLIELWMWGNPISGEAIVTILQALRGNNTLQELYIPSYRLAVKHKIRSIEQEINTKRRNQGVEEKLTIHLL
ncbi:protein NLRC3-like isoform X2 [Dysidea avara]|uniref:protein NLRC3-like isoform X2 n=1 Tax=Dysidea avara TaxID=196820 RepID=UPI00331DD9B5